MKIINIITTICIISFLTVSCQKQIRSTPELEQFFNTQEIEDINLVVEYFEKTIQKQTNIENIDSAYIAFAKQNLKDKYFHFDEFNRADITQLLDKIATNTFDNIWNYYKEYDHVSKDSITRLKITHDKKYMSYLSLISKENSNIEYIVNSIKPSRHHDAILLFTLYQYFEEKEKNLSPLKEFDDFNNRVIIAISIITVID